MPTSRLNSTRHARSTSSRRPSSCSRTRTSGGPGERASCAARIDRRQTESSPEFALYVPPGFSPRRTYPLIVALHGMNGRPVEMIMWLFGHDDPNRDGNWEDRHPRRDLSPLDAIVVAPDGHFNAMYRDVGEEDVMRVIDWAMQNYPIDPARVTITGPSMGGIGSAACALHHPGRFAAAEPLCGYHSYFVRGDIGAHALRPWEKFIAEQRSNVFWAENGMYLLLYIVHGTKDLPEENSGVLIDLLRGAQLRRHARAPGTGTQRLADDLRRSGRVPTGSLTHRRPRIRAPFASRRREPDGQTMRGCTSASLASSDAWGEVTARIDANNTIYVSAHGIGSLAIDRDPGTDRRRGVPATRHHRWPTRSPSRRASRSPCIRRQA